MPAPEVTGSRSACLHDSAHNSPISTIRALIPLPRATGLVQMNVDILACGSKVDSLCLCRFSCGFRRQPGDDSWIVTERVRAPTQTRFFGHHDAMVMRTLATTETIEPLDHVPLEARCRDDGAPWLFTNMVASMDGAAAVDGLSGPLGDPDDLAMFRSLRASADAIIVGAGTVNAERYLSLIHI